MCRKGTDLGRVEVYEEGRPVLSDAYCVVCENL